jgi:hypothetical protein
MGGNQFFDLLICDQFGHASARITAVIANNSQVFNAFSNQRIDEDLRRAGGHKAAHHNDRAIFDRRYRFFYCLYFVFHQPLLPLYEFSFDHFSHNEG